MLFVFVPDHGQEWLTGWGDWFEIRWYLPLRSASIVVLSTVLEEVTHLDDD